MTRRSGANHDPLASQTEAEPPRLTSDHTLRRNVMRPLRLVAMYSLLTLLAGSVGLAQQSATGEVNGSILDPTGAVVSGARVMLTNQGTKISGSAASNASGYYIFINLQPGIYVLTVEKE